VAERLPPTSPVELGQGDEELGHGDPLLRSRSLRASRSCRASRSSREGEAAPWFEAAAEGRVGCALIIHGASHAGLTFPGASTRMEPNRDASFVGSAPSGSACQRPAPRPLRTPPCHPLRRPPSASVQNVTRGSLVLITFNAGTCPGGGHESPPRRPAGSTARSGSMQP
jgi:hypothetical protein